MCVAESADHVRVCVWVTGASPIDAASMGEVRIWSLPPHLPNRTMNPADLLRCTTSVGILGLYI